jgi:hypothetical protein
LLERGRVVHAVACHTDDVTVLLEYFDDRIFVFWKDLSKPVGCVDLLRSIQRDLPFRHIAGKKFRGRLDICAHVQLQ